MSLLKKRKEYHLFIAFILSLVLISKKKKKNEKHDCKELANGPAVTSVIVALSIGSKISL